MLDPERLSHAVAVLAVDARPQVGPVAMQRAVDDARDLDRVEAHGVEVADGSVNEPLPKAALEPVRSVEALDDHLRAWDHQSLERPPVGLAAHDKAPPTARTSPRPGRSRRLTRPRRCRERPRARRSRPGPG